MLTNVNSKDSQAYNPVDETTVKEAIQREIGFEKLDRAVANNIAKWIGNSVTERFQAIHDDKEDQRKRQREQFRKLSNHGNNSNAAELAAAASDDVEEQNRQQQRCSL